VCWVRSGGSESETSPAWLENKRPRIPEGNPGSFSSRERTRTSDPVINSHLLYQLSYAGLIESPKVTDSPGVVNPLLGRKWHQFKGSEDPRGSPAWPLQVGADEVTNSAHAIAVGSASQGDLQRMLHDGRLGLGEPGQDRVHAFTVLVSVHSVMLDPLVQKPGGPASGP
jgi:hypothetical protein